MVIPAWVAAMISTQITLAEPRHRLAVAGEDCLEGLLPLPFGVRAGHRRDAIERKSRLGVERVLDPERAVLVEGGDAVLGRHEARAPLVGRRLDEIQDGLLGRAVVPGGERCRLGLRRANADKTAERRQRRKRAEQKTPVQAVVGREWQGRLPSGGVAAPLSTDRERKMLRPLAARIGQDGARGPSTAPRAPSSSRRSWP